MKKTIEFVELPLDLSLFLIFRCLFFGIGNFLKVASVVFDILNVDFDLLLLVGGLFLLVMLVLALGLFGGFNLDVLINWRAINSSNGTVVIMIITVKSVESFFTIFSLVFFVHVFIKIIDSF